MSALKKQRIDLRLNEESWNLVMDAIANPPVPNDRLKQAAKRIQELE